MVFVGTSLRNIEDVAMLVDVEVWIINLFQVAQHTRLRNRKTLNGAFPRAFNPRIHVVHVGFLQNKAIFFIENLQLFNFLFWSILFQLFGHLLLNLIFMSLAIQQSKIGSIYGNFFFTATCSDGTLGHCLLSEEFLFWIQIILGRPDIET